MIEHRPGFQIQNPALNLEHLPIRRREVMPAEICIPVRIRHHQISQLDADPGIAGLGKAGRDHIKRQTRRRLVNITNRNADLPRRAPARVIRLTRLSVTRLNLKTQRRRRLVARRRVKMTRPAGETVTNGCASPPFRRYSTS